MMSSLFEVIGDFLSFSKIYYIQLHASISHKEDLISEGQSRESGRVSAIH